MKRTAVAALVLLGTTSVASPSHAAEPWPKARPIQLVISGAPGGGTDTMGRVFAEKLAAQLGQSVIAENKPGANGMIGNDAVARAAPDGYTLLFTYAASVVANRWLMPSLPHDPQKDLTPIAQIGAGGNLLVVTKDFPARTFAEFVTAVKARPDTYNYGSWGTGSGGHVAMESIKQQAGLQMQHVPYKGVQPTLVDLKGGRLSVAFVDSTSALPMIQAGDIVPLVTSGTRRGAVTRDVPTLNEVGLTYNADAWYGLFGPRALPAPIVERLNTAVNDVLRDPEMLERFRQFNMPEPPLKSAAQFAQTIDSDIRTWGDVIQAANIRAE